MRTFIVAAGAVMLALSTPTAAQNFPLAPGNYWEVTGVKVDDGSGIKYASWLASEWRRFNDFSKSRGWITDYKILANVHPRKDEPDFYLIVQYPSLPDAAESEKRNEAFRAQMQRTDTQLANESGQRATYRHVLGTELLQELHFRN